MSTIPLAMVWHEVSVYHSTFMTWGDDSIGERSVCVHERTFWQVWSENHSEYYNVRAGLPETAKIGKSVVRTGSTAEGLEMLSAEVRSEI